MVAVLETPMEPMVLHNISWETYERLLEEMGECHYRLTYDKGELEFMTLSLEHENFGRWIGRLIFFIALELKMPVRTGGSTTLKKSLRKVGLEPDECFWLGHERAIRGKKKWNAITDPPPDLAVEIDITSGWLDRLGIYAGLKVPEVWRFDGESLKVLVLGANGKYRERSKSLAFPTLPLDGLVHFIVKLESTEEVALIEEFTQWLRTEVVKKTTRKNGK